jgi:predicted DNA-binding transcriptional regulator YafY
MNDEKQQPKTDDGNDSNKDQDRESQTLTLLQGIKDRSVNPKSLNTTDRRLLVGFLTVEGQSNAEIAHLLQVSDRTIERDRKALREENAVIKDPKLLEQIVGKLMVEAEVCTQRIRKFQREKEASAAVKIDGEHRCFQISCELTEKLQSLGFLPTATHRIEADLRHTAAISHSLEELHQETERLLQIQGMVSPDETEPFKSSVEVNETETEFEDQSPRQNDKGANHETGK